MSAPAKPTRKRAAQDELDGPAAAPPNPAIAAAAAAAAAVSPEGAFQPRHLLMGGRSAHDYGQDIPMLIGRFAGLGTPLAAVNREMRALVAPHGQAPGLATQQMRDLVRTRWQQLKAYRDRPEVRTAFFCHNWDARVERPPVPRLALRAQTTPKASTYNHELLVAIEAEWAREPQAAERDGQWHSRVQALLIQPLYQPLSAMHHPGISAMQLIVSLWFLIDLAGWNPLQSRALSLLHELAIVAFNVYDEPVASALALMCTRAGNDIGWRLWVDVALFMPAANKKTEARNWGTLNIRRENLFYDYDDPAEPSRPNWLAAAREVMLERTEVERAFLASHEGGARQDRLIFLTRAFRFAPGFADWFRDVTGGRDAIPDPFPDD